VFCLWRGYPTKLLPGTVHYICCQFRRKYVVDYGDWDYVWIYQSLVIFCRLVLNGNTSSIGFGICFLARAHIKMERRWDSDYWPFILLFSFSFCFSLGCIVYCVEKKCFIVILCWLNPKNCTVYYCIDYCNVQKNFVCDCCAQLST